MHPVINLKELAAEVEDKPGDAAPPPHGRRLSELLSYAENDPSELLLYRFLCRCAGLLLVGPTGVGKSSLAMQMMILWALGKAAFGIVPKGPLKSVLVQAENDDGDLAEMRDGVIRGLKLSPEEAKRACENVIVVREDSRTGLGFIAGTLRPLLAEHRPDLLWIDPALAYLGGEASSQKDVGGFLRNMLNPLLGEFNCGCVVVHHTNKPAKGKEKGEWQAGDFAYLGSGSIEWANWARGVLAVRSVGSHTIFELKAAKRGGRVRWKEADGETPTYAKVIGHSDEPGVICWQELDASELPPERGARKEYTKDDVMPHVPLDKPIAKEALRSRCNGAGIALNRINGFIAELVEEGRVFAWRVKRSRTNAMWVIGRAPPPPEELIKEEPAK
jgi:AAA domain